MGEEFITSAKGHSVFVRYRKSESSVLIVFIHGIGSNLTQWDYYQEMLFKKGISSISLDLPGSGRSQKLEDKNDYSMQSLADEVSSVVRRITDKPVILVGHSMGAMICLDITYRKLLSVEGIVLIEPVYENPFEQLMLGKGMEHLTEKIAEFFSRHVKAHRCVEPQMTKAKGKEIKLAVFSMLTMPLSVQVECISHMSKYDWRKAAEEIIVPVLIIAGGKDRVARVGSLGELIASLNTSELMIIENASHTMIIDIPERIAPLIESFAERIISGQTSG